MKESKEKCLICTAKNKSVKSFEPNYLRSFFNFEKNDFTDFVFCTLCKDKFVQLESLNLKLQDLKTGTLTLMLKNNQSFPSNSKATLVRSNIIKALSLDESKYLGMEIEGIQEKNLHVDEKFNETEIPVENNEEKLSQYSLRSSSKVKLSKLKTKNSSKIAVKKNHSIKSNPIYSSESPIIFDSLESKLELIKNPPSLIPDNETALKNPVEIQNISVDIPVESSEIILTEFIVKVPSPSAPPSDSFATSSIEITEKTGERRVIYKNVIKSEKQNDEVKHKRRSKLAKRGIYICQAPNCSFTSSKPHKTRQHYLLDHEKSPKPYVCYFQGCEETFASEAKLKYHASTHRPKAVRKKKIGEKSTCEICFKEYPSKDQLWRHKKLVHIKKYSSVCQVCRKELSTANTLKKHMSTFHDQNETFICEICANVFYTDRSLKEHRKFVHCPEEDRTCSICSKLFKNQRALQGHLKQIHGSEEEKIFKCDQCPYTHFMKCHMEKHMLIHGEKTFTCNFEGCRKKFVKEDYLKNHMLQHGDAKRFACPMCDVAFSKRHALEVHKKEHYKAEAIEFIEVEEVEMMDTVIVDGIQYAVHDEQNCI